MARYTGRHSINCPCPTCNYSVTETRGSDMSQGDADSQAEAAAWSAYNSHSCPCAGTG